MVRKADFKMVALVAVGVMLAGFTMFQLRDVALVNQARNGFDV
jgi:hypothetical protein